MSHPHEHRNRQYAELHPPATASREVVMGGSVAGQFISDDAAADEDHDENQGALDDAAGS